jgi:hypothetical protein
VSALERLGLEVVAYTLLGSRMTASVLLTLLDANGRQTSHHQIGNARRWRMEKNEGEVSRKCIQVRVCVLRDALNDLGLGGVIVTHDEGYSLPEPGRSAVLNRLISEASA